ncbi:MAG: hypothetical protein ACRCWG_18305 [Sarcina sp.]
MRREDLLKKFLGNYDINLIERDDIRKTFDSLEVIDNLVSFHSKVCSKKDYGLGLISEAGRLRNEQKIALLRMERFQEESNINLNEVIKYASDCISRVSDLEMDFLIKRSYKNSEITLGKIYQNICSRNNQLNVSDTSRIRFGMVEDDFIKFIRRIQRRYRNIDYSIMLKEFIEKENLNECSESYIKSVLGYPNEIANYISFAYLRDFDDEKVKEKLASIEAGFNIF